MTTWIHFVFQSSRGLATNSVTYAFGINSLHRSEVRVLAPPTKTRWFTLFLSLFANTWKVLQKKSASSGSQSPAVFFLLEAVNRRLNRLFNRDLEILLNNKLWKSASIYGEICMTDLRMGTPWELWTFTMVKESEETPSHSSAGEPFKKQAKKPQYICIYIYVYSPFKRMKNRRCVFTQLTCIVFSFLWRQHLCWNTSSRPPARLFN